MKLEEGDIVLCTVESISKASVFVNIEETQQQGNIVMSEIAPGRIKNLREYVVPKKRIVCKILRISGNRIELSLRRVTHKEKEERLNQEKLERSYSSVIKAIAKEKSKDILQKIKKKSSIYEFIQEAIETPKELEKIAGKDLSKKILEIIKEQKQKDSEIKKEFTLKSTDPTGIKIIKDILNIENTNIHYISAGKYLLKVIGKDKKAADKKAMEILKEIENQAKKKGAEFSIKEK